MNKSIFILMFIAMIAHAQSLKAAQPVSCSMYEKRYDLAKAKFEMDKENFKVLLLTKKIAMNKTQSKSGKVQVKLPLKHPAVKSLLGASLAMATHEALLQKCNEQKNELSEKTEELRSFTLEEQPTTNPSPTLTPGSSAS